MRARDVYSLITTPNLAATSDFHVAHFGATVVFEADWFVLLNLPGEEGGGFRLAFMHPCHPSRPPGPEAFSGLGMILTVQVDNAAATHEALRRSGAPITYGLTDEPWGQRRFMTRDPAGLMIDVVEQIEPAAGFWDRYNAHA
jgi:catechol 2,3-dioxygenase-like lactoylglutathione lyase family enzyme